MSSIDKRLERIEEKLGIDTKKTTRIAVVQDKSSSMGLRQDATISGFNEYVSDLVKDDSDEAFLTLIQFDTRYRVELEDVPVAKVPELDKDSYMPNGMTALYDAVGRAINELKRNLNDGDRALVVIMTDGQENSSREFSATQIRELIKDCENEGNWTFVYLGAGKEAWSGGMNLGIKQDQHVLYGGDAQSHKASYAGLSAGTRMLRSSSSMSHAALGNEAKKTMDDLGANVQNIVVQSVEKEKKDASSR